VCLYTSQVIAGASALLLLVPQLVHIYSGISPSLQKYSICKFGVLLSKIKHHTITIPCAGTLYETQSKNSTSDVSAAIRSANHLKRASRFYFISKLHWLTSKFMKVELSPAYSALVYYIACRQTVG